MCFKPGLRHLFAILLGTLAGFAAYESDVLGACQKEKCKDITSRGQVVNGVEICTQIESSDCVTCKAPGGWCEEPFSTVDIHCNEDTSVPQRLRNCTLPCGLKCKANTNGMQEANCTGTGTFVPTGANRHRCQDHT